MSKQLNLESQENVMLFERAVKEFGLLGGQTCLIRSKELLN